MTRLQSVLIELDTASRWPDKGRMRRAIGAVAVLIWGAWFGAIVHLFFVVSSVFHTLENDHDQAGKIASALFKQFDFAAMGLAASLLFVLVLWYALGKQKLKLVIFAIVAGATLALAYSMETNPKIDELRLRRATASAEFQRLHGQAMEVYGSEALALLVAGALMPFASAVPQKKPTPSDDQA